jgi:hypothetical protein
MRRLFKKNGQKSLLEDVTFLLNQKEPPWIEHKEELNKCKGRKTECAKALELD